MAKARAAEGGAAYDLYDYERDTPIIVLAITFAVVVGLVARLRGLASLVGLAFAFCHYGVSFDVDAGVAAFVGEGVC